MTWKLTIAAALILFSCKKGETEALTCEDTNTTKVTFRNTTASPLRVVVSATLTPQFVPVDPILTIDLAPGQSVVKEFQAGRYVNTWYNNCATSCSRMSYGFKDFTQCGEFEEKR